MKSKKYVIVDSRRFFIFITFILVICAIIVFSVFSMPRVYSNAYSLNYEEYKVSEGDNLWSISLNYMPKGYDVRKMVYDIKKFNDMETSYIYTGDTIKIPIINE